MKDQNSVILLWDLDTDPAADDGDIVLWRSFSQSPTITSIPKIIEENGSSLRSKLVSWIHDVGIADLGGKSMLSTLTIRKGFSYWWMTEFAEMQHFGKSPQLYDVVRLLVLEQLITDSKPAKIIFVTDRLAVNEVLKNWCDKLGIALEIRRTGRGMKMSARELFFKYTPQYLQAIAFLVKFILVHFRVDTVRSKVQGLKGEITALDYLVSPPKNNSGKYESNYYTQLVDLIVSSRISTNWIHFWVGSSGKNSFSLNSANDLIEGFSQNSKCQSHFLLNSRLSLSTFIKVCQDYIKLNYEYSKIRRNKKKFRCLGSDFDFMPLFEMSLNRSIQGAEAISNLIHLNHFEELCRNIPKQKLSIYLQENLGWENAFIYAWKQAGHGKLIGVPHVTIRPWDLRYFVDLRSFELKNYSRPKPDLIALNSDVAVDLYNLQSYPSDELVKVEALRYLYLNDIKVNEGIPKRGTASSVRILILGDYLLTNTTKQLEWVVSAQSALPRKLEYTFKPHPVCPIEPGDYPTLELEIGTDSFADLFKNCDAVFTSNVTSSAVDAYSAGVPVITMIDGDTFNMSPLTGLDGVSFVRNPQELAIGFEGVQNFVRHSPTPYFYLNRTLESWRKVLKEEGIQFHEATN
jgi:surface carbohydrate biosynthesis protein (TIGR04326 family)